MNLFDMAKVPMAAAEKAMKLDPGAAAIIAEPERVLEVHIPVRMDDGSLKVFTGYRAQHSTVLGPAKGGVRYHPSVNLDEVKTLSFWMTCKCAVAGLPYGGGKGGIICNPAEMSKGELERMTRGYIDRIAPCIGEKLDIPAPDMNTNGQVMAWMMDEYSKIKNQYEPGFITGKPLGMGGSEGRTAATGMGVVVAAFEAMYVNGIDPEKATVAVQGYGNVGSWTAKLFAKRGCKVVAVSDVKGAIYCEDGLDFEALDEYVAANKTVVGFPGTKEITNAELLALPVTILAPCAMELQLTGENADAVQATMIVEGANGPTTPEADAVFEQKGIFVVPDILANGGGVTVSYFEWVQNLYRYFWSEEEVVEKQTEMMKRAFKNVYEASKKYGVTMRVAAYIVALNAMAMPMKMRGIY
ncbi:MAG: Glu/Leu/Phe/Val dehydrogenase [Acidaminococcaceae bacterium]|nr:Glu/Leu/Phe/Val dehydrogenase [Acidaminococcaceae bacterium]